MAVPGLAVPVSQPELSRPSRSPGAKPPAESGFVIAAEMTRSSLADGIKVSLTVTWPARPRLSAAVLYDSLATYC